MSAPIAEKLYLRFHGRIIDSLGIQMYQSPVAAIAELIANTWDADATKVEIQLPSTLDEFAVITVTDDGSGMTFEQCQDRYLKVGRNRRVDEESGRSPKGRPVLGRKGIGKFAAFGIADVVRIDTTSGETGERTAFELNLNDLRGNEFVETTNFEVPLIEKAGPDEARKTSCGTVITLKSLKVSQNRTPETYARSMARRFLLNQQVDNFRVVINGISLPDDEGAMPFEFDFPSDYKNDEIPEGLTLDGKWGVEAVDGGQSVRWRIRFTKTPIDVDELRGISVFCGVKIAQTPFFFNLSGGLSGQHGQQYMAGVVKADYLDQLNADVITTERQRINWENPRAIGLLRWGESRTKELLSIWKERRAEEKIRLLDQKLTPFSERLDRLPPRERKIVAGAVRKIASIETLKEDQFFSLSQAILTAWEGGRLKELIEDVSRMEQMTEGVLLGVLVEAKVLNALHVAEAVRAKQAIVHGLAERIKNRELENAVRDYIAENPWLLSPEWETFKKETSVENLVKAAAAEAKLDDDPDWKKRVDLVLSSGRHLLIIEFMRPGLTVDRDHLNRFQTYIDILREKIKLNTALRFENVSGLLVADNLNRPPGVPEFLERLARADMKCMDWETLLAKAEAQWKEFFAVLVSRAPEDGRLKALM